MLDPLRSALIRGWAQGLPLERLAAYYLNHERPGKVLGVLNGLRESLRDRAEKHARPDLAEVFGTPARNWPRHGAAVLEALDQIEHLGEPHPTLAQPPARWLPARLARKLPAARFPDGPRPVPSLSYTGAATATSSSAIPVESKTVTSSSEAHPGFTLATTSQQLGVDIPPQRSGAQRMVKRIVRAVDPSTQRRLI